MTGSRTFIVRVTDSPRRVIVEDVRERRRTVAGGLEGIGAQIAVWLDTPATARADEADYAPREDSVSPPT